jgi:hypothetical protein
MSDFVLFNGLVSHMVAFRLVVVAGIVISVLLAVGLHFSILQETVKQSFFVFIFQNLQTQVIISSQFWFGAVMIENDYKNCMVAAGSEYITHAVF